MIAYEHFRYLRQEKIDKFNDKLRREGSSVSYKRLKFVPISSYQQVPPEHVLASLEAAKKFECFVDFQVAFIEEVKDPILLVVGQFEIGRYSGSGSKIMLDHQLK